MPLDELIKYGQSFVLQALHVLYGDAEYLQTVHDAINLNHYTDPRQRWLVERALLYFKKYHGSPSDAYIESEVRKEMEIDPEFGKSLFEMYKRVKGTFSPAELEYVREEFLSFCQQRAAIVGMGRAMELIHAGNMGEALRIIEQSMMVGRKRHIGHAYSDVEYRYAHENNPILPLPFDEHNLRMSEGGVSPGDLILILGKGGGGKSWYVVNWMSSLLKLGYKVLHFNLESRDKNVGKRYDANLLGIPIDELKFQVEEVQQLVDSLEGQLIIKDLYKDERTPDYINDHMYYLKREFEFVPNFVVIDYIDRMKFASKTVKADDWVRNQSDMYKYIIDIAKDNRVPIVSPVPIGRDGIKDKIITEDKIKGAFDKIYDADLILSFSPFNALHWIKNKNGKAGMTDLMAYDPSMGRFQYMGEFADTDEVESIGKKIKTTAADRQTIMQTVDRIFSHS